MELCTADAIMRGSGQAKLVPERGHQPVENIQRMRDMIVIYRKPCRAASDMLFEGKCGFTEKLCACERIHKLLK